MTAEIFNLFGHVARRHPVGCPTYKRAWNAADIAHEVFDCRKELAEAGRLLSLAAQEANQALDRLRDQPLIQAIVACAIWPLIQQMELRLVALRKAHAAAIGWSEVWSALAETERKVA